MPGCNAINKKKRQFQQVVRKSRQSYKHVTSTTSSDLVVSRNATLFADDAETLDQTVAIVPLKKGNDISIGHGKDGQLRCIRKGKMGKNNTIVRPIPLGKKKVKALLKAIRNQAKLVGGNTEKDGDVMMTGEELIGPRVSSKATSNTPCVAFASPVKNGVGTLLGGPVA